MNIQYVQKMHIANFGVGMMPQASQASSLISQAQGGVAP
jgi:hypothetical protein